MKNECDGDSSSALSAEHVDGFCNSGVGLQMKIINFVKSSLYQLAIIIPDQKLWRQAPNQGTLKHVLYFKHAINSTDKYLFKCSAGSKPSPFNQYSPSSCQ